MPCEGMSFEQGKYTNWTAAGGEQQLVEIHTKQGCERMKNKSQISWTMASHSCIRQIPKKWYWYGQGEITHRSAGFESPWLKKSWFNIPNPNPRAPGGFLPPVLHLHPFTFGEMELSLPILAKNPRCAPCTMEEIPSKLTGQQRERKEKNPSKYEKLIAN